MKIILILFTILSITLTGCNQPDREIVAEPEIKVEKSDYQKEKEQIEVQRKEALQEAKLLLSSDSKKAIEQAICNMNSYSDLVSVLGEPDKVERRVNGADLAVWRIDGVTIHISERKNGTTSVYAFEGKVSENIASKTFKRMLLN